MNGKQAKKLRRLALQLADPNARPEHKITRYKVADKFRYNKDGSIALDEKGLPIHDTIDRISLAHGKNSARRTHKRFKKEWAKSNPPTKQLVDRHIEERRRRDVDRAARTAAAPAEYVAPTGDQDADHGDVA
jgi:hypothetical protein